MLVTARPSVPEMSPFEGIPASTADASPVATPTFASPVADMVSVADEPAVPAAAPVAPAPVDLDTMLAGMGGAPSSSSPSSTADGKTSSASDPFSEFLSASTPAADGGASKIDPMAKLKALMEKAKADEDNAPAPAPAQPMSLPSLAAPEAEEADDSALATLSEAARSLVRSLGIPPLGFLLSRDVSRPKQAPQSKYSSLWRAVGGGAAASAASPASTPAPAAVVEEEEEWSAFQ